MNVRVVAGYHAFLPLPAFFLLYFCSLSTTEYVIHDLARSCLTVTELASLAMSTALRACTRVSAIHRPSRPSMTDGPPFELHSMSLFPVVSFVSVEHVPFLGRSRLFLCRLSCTRAEQSASSPLARRASQPRPSAFSRGRVGSFRPGRSTAAATL